MTAADFAPAERRVSSVEDLPGGRAALHQWGRHPFAARRLGGRGRSAGTQGELAAGRHHDRPRRSTQPPRPGTYPAPRRT